MATRELTMEELKELFASTVEAKLKELGLDKVDIKHGMIPQETKEKEEEFAKLPKEERFREFLKGVIKENDLVVKDLGGATNPEGGYLIPTEFKAEIIKGLQTVGIMRPLVRVVKVTNRTGEYPVLASRPQFSKGTENQPFTQSEPSFDQITYTVSRIDVYSALSQELLADSAIDLTSLIRELFVEQYALKEDQIMSEADNVSFPCYGVGKDPNITEILLTTDLTYDNLVETFHTLKPAYRTQAVWVVSSKAMEVLRKLKDDTGYPLLIPPQQGGTPTIFGRPVVENPYLEDTLVDPDGNPASGDEYYTGKIVLGHFKQAFLFDRGEFGIKSTTEGDAFLKNQVWIKSWNRIDFKVVLPEAFVRVVGVK